MSQQDGLVVRSGVRHRLAARSLLPPGRLIAVLSLPFCASLFLSRAERSPPDLVRRERAVSRGVRPAPPRMPPPPIMDARRLVLRQRVLRTARELRPNERAVD